MYVFELGSLKLQHFSVSLDVSIFPEIYSSSSQDQATAYWPKLKNMGTNTTRQIEMMRAQSTTGRQQKSIQQVHTAGIRVKRDESKFGVVKRRDGILKSEYIRVTKGSNFF